MNSLNVLIILLSHFCSVQSWKLPELIRENETKNNKTFETRLKSDRGVKQSLRIIHGDVSNPGDYPFVVSLMQQEYDEMKHFCAGGGSFLLYDPKLFFFLQNGPKNVQIWLLN